MATSIPDDPLVTVELADGTCGYGEAAPFTPFNGETQDSAFQALQTCRTAVEGADAREWRRIALHLRDTVKECGSARCALETAILDALTRQAHMPLWAFFGGVSRQLETDMTITTPVFTNRAEAIAHAGTSARNIVARGIRTIKTKVGAGDVQMDVERLEAIQANAPGSSLILDGNGGYTADGALDLIATLRAKDIVPILFEQPVPGHDLQGLRKVTQNSGLPVAADESAHDLASARRVIEAQAATVVNINLMKCGVVEALDIAALCRSSHTDLMIGGMVESVLAMSMSACFAGGVGGFSYVDLDTPFFMASNPFKSACYQQEACLPGRWLELSRIEEGHGVSPR
jgi:L-alanine-DL-glutamate epimerase-like enolase superfamily enzyme